MQKKINNKKIIDDTAEKIKVKEVEAGEKESKTEGGIKISLPDTKGLKIFITGDSGAGKSTTAKALQEHLDIPVFHTDWYRYTTDGALSPYNEFKAAIDGILSENQSYIIDGMEFGDDHTIFKRLVKEADIILHFDVTPRQAINAFTNRYFDYIEKGIPHIGLKINSDFYSSVENFKNWLDVYYDFLEKKKVYAPLIESSSEKVIKIRNYQEADKLITEFRSGKLLKQKAN